MVASSAETRCAYPWQQMIIDLTGEVFPCCYWSGYGNIGKPLGNTNTATIAEIWNGEEYRALRARLAGGDLTDHPCGNCVAYRWAGGTFPKFTWPAGFTHESGHCYFGRIQESFLAAIRDSGLPVTLHEDGQPLPTPDAPHADIRALGEGRYSVWHGWLYFSASDNSNPIESGRRYELVCGEQVAPLATLAPDATSTANIRKAHAEFVAGATQLDAKPTMVSYISTADCNIDCPSCSQNIVRYARIQHRPGTTEQVLALVPYLASLVWHGGEPYLIKQFRNFIDSFTPALNPNLVFGFTSNGQQITADEAEKLKRLPQINASVSIDSFNAETFARIRTGGNFPRILDNLHRLMTLYDAPQRVFSVGMIVCKSNMAELADNLAYAIAHDIGINLSPVLVYPVNEQLNVFSDFESQTAGWQDALDRAAALVEAAKREQRRAVQRIDPTGMVAELRNIYDQARHTYADVIDLPCEIRDPHQTMSRMRKPGLIVYAGGSAVAYTELDRGEGHYVVRLPLQKVEGQAMMIELVHSLLEPQAVLAGAEATMRGAPGFSARIWMPRFDGAPRPRNITYANYGDATPDGVHVRNSLEINQAYRALHAHELRNEGARIDIIDGSRWRGYRAGGERART